MGQASEKCVSMLMARKKSGALVAALCFDLILQILYVFIFRLALAEQGVRNFFWQIYDPPLSAMLLINLSSYQQNCIDIFVSFILQ